MHLFVIFDFVSLSSAFDMLPHKCLKRNMYVVYALYIYMKHAGILFFCDRAN